MSGFYDQGKRPIADHDPTQQIQWEIQKLARGLSVDVASVIQWFVDAAKEALEEQLKEVVDALLGFTTDPSTMLEQVAEWAAKVPMLNGAGKLSISIIEGLSDILENIGTDIIPDLLQLLTGSPGDLPDFANWLREGVTGEISPDRLGFLPLSALIDAEANRLYNPGFDTDLSIAPETGFTWSGTVGRSLPIGSAQVIADGTTKTLLSNYIRVFPGQTFEHKMWARYRGAVSTGPGIILNTLPYVTKGTPATVIQEGRDDITPVGDSSNPGQADFLLMESGYQVPLFGVSWIRLMIQVTDQMTAGQVNFDDGDVRPVLAKIPVDKIEGVLGGLSIGDTVQQIVDRLSTAFGGLGSGFKLADLATLAEDQKNRSEQAMGLAIDATNVLNQRNDRRVVAGLDANAEGNFDLTDCGEGAAPSSVTVSSVLSAGTFVRVDRADTKASVTWYGSGSANITGFYINLYKLDPDTETATKFHTSPDLKAQLSSGWNWNIYSMPSVDEFDVANGDIILVEWVLTGTGTHLIASKNLDWLASHPSAIPRRPAIGRTVGTLSPATIMAGSLGYSSKVPWCALGGVMLPTEYHPPETWTLATGMAGNDDFVVYNVPSWAQYLDVIVLGGGGGGESSQWNRGGYGGTGGLWNSVTLERGVHIHSGETTLEVHVGKGGPITVVWYQLGNNGSASWVRYQNASDVATLIDGAGGLGGNRAGNLNTNQEGITPGNHVHNGTTYYGGATTSQVRSVGDAPGAGGPGAIYATTGAAGADGQVWIVAR